jgi:phage-related protein
VRPLQFVGRAYEELKGFPQAARYRAGYRLKLVQLGEEPPDWKPMPSIGIGVRELRIWEETGTYRVVDVARFEEAVYVLHCFEKKSGKTPRAAIELAARRYRQLTGHRGGA